MMTCFEFRQTILANPREKTPMQEQHMTRCAKCAALAREVEDFDARIHEAAMVAVPEALADRVLLRHKVREPAGFGGFGFGAWALAASLVIVLGAVVQLYRADSGDAERVATSAAAGEGHAAIAAISYVLDHEPQLLQDNVSGDPAVMRTALARLGLSLPSSGLTVRYLGKCPVPGGTGEHVVLRGAFGQVTLILVPDQYLGPRVTVVDRQLTALATPARSGGYILVADSPDHLSRVEKMLM